MATANEVIKVMEAQAYRYVRGFGGHDGMGSIQSFVCDAYDHFGEGEYRLIRDQNGLLYGGEIELEDGAVVRATTCCDRYGVVKGWYVREVA